MATVTLWKRGSSKRRSRYVHILCSQKAFFPWIHACKVYAAPILSFAAPYWMSVIVLDADAQIISLEVNLEKQNQDHQALLTRRKSLEDKYRTRASQFMDEIEVEARIKKAQESAQTNKELGAIHDAHNEVETKAKEIKTTKGELQALHEDVPKLREQLSRLETQSHDTKKNVRTQPCTHTHTHTHVGGSTY